MCVHIPPSAFFVQIFPKEWQRQRFLRLPEIGWENLDILASCVFQMIMY